MNPSSSYFTSLSPQVNVVISLRSAAGWRRRIGKKTWATFHRKPQLNGKVTDLHSGGCRFESSWWAEFFLKINTFCIHAFFLNSALIALLFDIPSMHWNGSWAKLNTHHLGTWLWWLLMDICFCLFFTAPWRHWCREKMGNSCACQNHAEKQWLTSSA